MKSSYLYLLAFIMPVITSCVTTYNFKPISLEMMKPGLLLTDSIDTIAIFNTNSRYSNYDTFNYFDIAKNKFIKDSLLKYKDLQNICTDTLAEYLQSSGYYKAVINYRDSLNYPDYAEDIFKRQKNGHTLYYDACISLNYFELIDKLQTNRSYFDKTVIQRFPEFENATMMETVYTMLNWKIYYKKGSFTKEYRRLDNLYYGNSVNFNFFGNEENHRKLVNNAALSTGQSFASELFPHLGVVERIYYRSHHPRMMRAQKKLLSENYKEAAAIYRPLIKSRNPNIAAKATYNMALICEIEGDPVAALDWLTLAEKTIEKRNKTLFYNYSEYLDNLLVTRNDILAMNPQIQTDNGKVIEK